MLHRNLLGNPVAIRPGEIDLIVAARRILHAERLRAEVKAPGNIVAELPLGEGSPVKVQALSGSAYGVRALVRTFVETLYLVAELKAGQHLMSPDGGGESAIYPVSGSLSVEPSPEQAREMAVLSSRTRLTFTARENSRVVLIGGSPWRPVTFGGTLLTTAGNASSRPNGTRRWRPSRQFRTTPENASSCRKAEALALVTVGRLRTLPTCAIR